MQAMCHENKSATGRAFVKYPAELCAGETNTSDFVVLVCANQETLPNEMH